MGHWEWERGDFKLPTSEFARVRNAVAAADRATKEQIFDLSQTFWKSLTPKQKRDAVEYGKAANSFISVTMGKTVDSRPGTYLGSVFSAEVIEGLDFSLTTMNGRYSGTPKRLLASEADYPNNRTLKFSGHDVDVTFDKTTSSVVYGIHQDRHTIENAYGSAILIALKSELRSMRWTRGTGGTVNGDNESAEDARQEHGGMLDGYKSGSGPIGAAVAPLQTKPWKDPKGDTFHAQAIHLSSGSAGRVKKGVPAGGQFAGRHRSEANIFLR